MAGAVGTYAIDLTTYLDVVVRARASSSVPGDTAQRIAESAGLRFATGDDEAATNRRNGLGALMGYVAGVAGGLAYSVVPGRSSLPLAVRGLALGAVVMAATDGASVATGATDLQSWGVAGWLADAIPHAVYGLVTVAVHDFLST